MGTHHHGTESEIRALDAFIKLIRASESVGRRVHGSLQGAGLTVSQFGVLEALHHLGPLCQKVLGEKLLKSAGNITTVVDNLERRGMVLRVRSTEDRRFVLISLTDEGRALIRDVFPAHVRRIEAALGVLSPEEQVELARLCRKVGKSGREW